LVEEKREELYGLDVFGIIDYIIKKPIRGLDMARKMDEPVKSTPPLFRRGDLVFVKSKQKVGVIIG